MTFPINVNIPAAGNNPADDQPGMQVNFSNINSVIAVDHIEPGASSNNGKHNQSRYPERASGPTTLANEGAVYCKVGTNPAETNLFFRAESSGTEYQLTQVSTAASASFGSLTSTLVTGSYTLTGGWTFLPGGLILNYGVVTRTTGGPNFEQNTNIAVNFIRSFTTPLTVNFQVLRTTVAVESISFYERAAPTASGFTFLTTSGTVTALYIHAIGK